MRLFAVVLAFTAIGAGAGAASAAASRDDALAGTWQGTVWETAPAYHQGQKQLDIRVGGDGTWRGTIDGRPASGAIRWADRWVVVEGTAQGPHGRPDLVYYRLVGDAETRPRSDRLWGEIVGTFPDRPGRASVSLQRVG